MPGKIATATTNSKKIFDESFTKNTFVFHPTIIPFLTAMELNDIAHTRSNSNEDEMSDDEDNKVPTDKDVDDIKLQPFIAPVNHNTLTLAKALNIVHILMGNFCHSDKEKISQQKDMGNNVCVLMGYRDKVCFFNSCQIIQIVNDLIHHLTLNHLQNIHYQKNGSVEMIRLNPQQLQDKPVTGNLFPPTEDLFLKLFTEKFRRS